MCFIKSRNISMATVLSTFLAVFIVLSAGIMPVFAQEAPSYKVDPFWPQELPDALITGAVAGVTVDSHDHIWVVQRPGTISSMDLGAAADPPTALCCVAAKPVMEFDQEGKLLQQWGGPGEGYDWPSSEHGIYVDKNDNVWLAGGNDRQVLKFTRDGQFLMQIGRPSTEPVNSNNTDLLGGPTGMEVDEAAHEVYIADGYKNKRVIVYDSDTGAFKRLWGAYGKKPSDASQGGNPYASPNPDAGPPEQFTIPHAVHISNDGLVYVCDRNAGRIQVFTKQGEFVKEFFIRSETWSRGSPWDLAFSPDKEQKYLVVADGSNDVVWILSRSDGEVLGHFGNRGQNAGEFMWVHGIASDSAGNIYTAEVEQGKRIQKFLMQK